MTIQILTRSILSILFSSASCRNGRSACANLYARWSLCQPWSHRLGEHDDTDTDDVDKNGGVDDDEVTKVLFHLGIESTLFFSKNMKWGTHSSWPTRRLRRWCTTCWWGRRMPVLTGIQRWTGVFSFQPDCNPDDIRFQLFCLPRYGPMGIGYAPNKELYTEHFLKPLRAAFSDRDLQVC